MKGKKLIQSLLFTFYIDNKLFAKFKVRVDLSDE